MSKLISVSILIGNPPINKFEKANIKDRSFVFNTFVKMNFI